MNSYQVPHARSETSVGPPETNFNHPSTSLFTLQGLMRVLIKRWIWIIVPIVVFEILAIVATVRTKPIYEATATIELNKGSAGSLDLGLGDSVGQQLTSGGDSLLTDLQTETAILQGDSLALAVIQHLNLASQPPFAGSVAIDVERGLPLDDAPRARTRLLSIFKGHLRVQPARGTRLIMVTYESEDPKQAAQIANALIDSYKAQYLQSHYDATSEASDWLTKQLSELKTNVEDSEKKVTNFEKESGILSLPTGPGSSSAAGGGEIHSVVIQKLDALNSELTAAEANRIEKEAIYRLTQTGNQDVIVGLQNDPLAIQGNSMVLTQGGGVSNLKVLQQKQNEQKVNLASASTTYGANNRHLKDLQNQVKATDDQIHQEMQQIARRAQADFQLAQQTEDEIRRRFDKQQDAASKLNEKAVEFAVLSQEAFSRKRLYEDLYTKLQEANVSAGIKATNITIVDPARSQSVPVRPRRRNNLAMGVLFGLFIGLAIAFAVDNLDRTINNPLEVEEITGRPVLGVIPSFGESAAKYGYKSLGRRGSKKVAPTEPSVPTQVWMIANPDSAASEAFRALRTTIMLSRAGGGPKVILVTSCIPGEGKTTVATNLGVAFAQHNKKVIIVEADMRRPKLKDAMVVSNEIGLSSLLAGTHTRDEAIVRGVSVPTLDILPAGPRPPMPSEMLGSAEFDRLLEDLRSRYDIVLIDSPPALLVTDAVSISTKTDATIWIVRAGVAVRPQLARAANLIERNGMPVIGFVLNRMTRAVAGYGYGSGYDYQYNSSYYGEKSPNDA